MAVAHENRLVEDHLGDQLLGHVQQVGDDLLDAVDHRDGVGVAALFEHRQIDRGLAVDAHLVVLDLRGVLRLAHVAHQHRGLAHRFERHQVDVLHGIDLAVGIDVVIIRADFHVARRQNQIGFVHRAHHVHDAQLVRLQFERIHIHHDLAIASAEGRRHRRARHAGHLVANGELAQVAQLRFAQAFAFQRDQADRQAGGVKFHHHRRQRAGRQIAQVGHGQIGDAGHVGIGIGAGLEINLDQTHARSASATPCGRCRCARVNMRSNCPVMSFSICSGGMPE